ncbi:NAD-dependent deacetylase [Anaerostipes sp.]|uniref:SIR2 family NAD-dependent protein deacylase n=2 Tax=Anaerostipes sp. TaxID=1872530 RepID=UPI0035272FCF
MHKITFQTFLSGTPARDYIFQKTPYEEQIMQAADMIQKADYVLMGAGAGLSTAAGAVYGGTWFEKNFKEFKEKYGNGPYMQDMYSAGFHPYPDEESFWGYWSKQAILGGIDLDVTPLYKDILKLLKDKRTFCLSTNADGQFQKAGYKEEQIFCTQGDYFHIQCQKACHQRTYNAVKLFKQMDQARKNCQIPTYMVPKCPICGGPMTMNLRCDQYFVQDEAWYQAEKRFGDFLNEALKSQKNLLLLELGVGFNTPTIIRFPFEKLVKENKQVNLIRLNLNEAVIPESIEQQAVGINKDIKQTIKDLHTVLSGI